MSTVQQIKKRNGEIVFFDPEKITRAMQRAFQASRSSSDEAKLKSLTDEIVAQVESTFADRVPSVEDIQNYVEWSLMKDGFYDVAKAYIIYRYEHAKQREEKKREDVKKIEEKKLLVTKRSGKQEPFSPEKIRIFLEEMVKGYKEEVDADAIIEQCKLEIYDGISTKDITRSLVMITRSWIEQDPAYSKVAARILFRSLYKKVIGEDAFDASRIAQQYSDSFVRNVQKGVALGKLDPRLLEYNLEYLSKELKPERDDLLLYIGAQTLYDRYFLQKPGTREILETPQSFWMRVSMGLALAEKPEERERRTVEFYHTISTLRFVPSTPTLFHAGTTHPQLSSCYLTTVEDALDHIFKCIGDNAQLSKWSGGLGNDWTNLRATGAIIRGIGVESQGVIPFLKIANDTTAAINRSGRRRGATCAYMETWHYDIEEFIELRKNTGDERRRTHDMNTAQWIPDLFMKRVREDGDWTLFSPDETPDLHHIYGKKFDERYAHYEALADQGKVRLWKRLKARDLWKKMLSMLYETGHPWVTFKDPCNIRSPQDHVGVVHSSNLCTEITLNTSAEETAVCNLGSVNFSRHIKDGKMDRELMKDTVTTAMRMLDNVVDINFYPTPEARHSNMKHRPVGLGIMGFQDALYVLDVPFDSDRMVQLADETMELVSYHAISASAMLAKERGPYSTYHGSKWDRGIFPVDTMDILEEERGLKIDVPRSGKLDWAPVRELVKKYGMRNSNTMAVAPTATISNIAGCYPSIEPGYKNIYVKSNVSGDFVVINPYLVEDLKQLKLWDYEMVGKIKYHDGRIGAILEIPASLKEKYKEAFDIDSEWLIRAAAYRGKWIDQSQSLNIFFNGTSGKRLSEIYSYAWEMGVKTTYYLRSLAASQVEKSTVDAAKFGSTHVREGFQGAPAVAAPVVVESKPVLQPVKTPVVETVVSATPSCKIDDPNCEACQ